MTVVRLFVLIGFLFAVTPAAAQLSATQKKAIEDAKTHQAEKETLEAIEDSEEETDAPAKKEVPITRYAPDFCDFEITFPSAPYTSKRCPEGAGRCYDLTGFTMVYDMETTVDVSVTCVPSTAANYKNYNERVIKAALNGMVKRSNVTDYTINTKEAEDYRQGVLIGTGKYGRQNRIFNAQLWIGQNSIFTMEAKLIGDSHDKADAVFSDILRSIKVKEKAD